MKNMVEGGGGGEMCVGRWLVDQQTDSLLFDGNSSEYLGVVSTESSRFACVKFLLEKTTVLSRDTRNLKYLFQWCFDSNNSGGINRTPETRVIKPASEKTQCTTC